MSEFTPTSTPDRQTSTSLSTDWEEIWETITETIKEWLLKKLPEAFDALWDWAWGGGNPGPATYFDVIAARDGGDLRVVDSGWDNDGFENVIPAATWFSTNMLVAANAIKADMVGGTFAEDTGWIAGVRGNTFASMTNMTAGGGFGSVNASSDPQVALDSGVLALVRALGLHGTDPLQMAALARSDAQTVAELQSDLQGAGLLSQLLEQPGGIPAFLEALSPEQHEEFNAFLKRFQDLGIIGDLSSAPSAVVPPEPAAVPDSPDGRDELRNVDPGEFAAITVGSPHDRPDTAELYQNLVGGTLEFGLPTRYVGPNAPDFILPATDGSDVLQGTSRNDFANLGAGDDAANMGAGDDVTDGGGGSNFLTGGLGRDSFYVDVRDLIPVWSCITDWQPGETLTVWGWRAGVSQAVWSESDGLPGYLGATMFADIDGNGLVETAITWTGVAKANLPTGQAFEVSGNGVLYFT